MEHGAMVVECRPVGPFAMNSYVVGCSKTNQGAIVDSGGETSALLALAESHQLVIAKLLQTHGHLDHVAGLGEMQAATSAPIHLHPSDAPVYNNAEKAGRMFGWPVQNPPPFDVSLADGDVVELGELRFKVLFTPGHCPGHVCFYEADCGVMFCGDLIFSGSIGRVDLPGASPKAMKESLARVMNEIPDDVVLYPGHMEPTTIGRERQVNPFIRQLDSDWGL